MVRAQKISHADGLLVTIFNHMDEILSLPELSEVKEMLLENIGAVLDAYEQRDYVLMADYMKIGVQSVLVEQIMSMFMEEEGSGIPGYDLEPTAAGVNTLAKTVNGKRFYLHSNVNPFEEADLWNENWAEKDIFEYHIIGLGLGYHIERLSWETAYDITVYEEDENVIEMAKRNAYIWKLLEQRANVHIVHDRNYEKLGKIMKNLDGKYAKIIPYHPSVQSVKNPEIKNILEHAFLNADNSKRWEPRMLSNFIYNTNVVKKEVGELREQFKNKTVYLIAGGPSLDKNIHFLKDRKEDEIVLTVFRSLMRCVEEDVEPDFAIVTDPKPDTGALMNGIEGCEVPLLMLSTTFKTVTKGYKGEKYLLCQKGYFEAEELAEKKGYETFETGGSVTTTALDFCIRMRVKKIVFLGLDLAFTGGRSHHGQTENDVSEHWELMVEDVGGNKVGTSKSFNNYRLWIENRIEKAKKEGCDIEFIDATEGGASIKGTQIKSLKKVLTNE